MAKKPTKAQVVNAAATVTLTPLAVAIAVQTILFVLYWRYMNSLKAKGCACAMTPRFAKMRSLFKVVVVLFYAAIACMLLRRVVPGLIGGLVAIVASLLSLVVSVYVVRWWLEMRAAGCACSDAWEKHLWAFLSAYQIASIVVGAVGGLLAAI